MLVKFGRLTLTPFPVGKGEQFAAPEFSCHERFVGAATRPPASVPDNDLDPVAMIRRALWTHHPQVSIGRPRLFYSGVVFAKSLPAFFFS